MLVVAAHLEHGLDELVLLQLLAHGVQLAPEGQHPLHRGPRAARRLCGGDSSGTRTGNMSTVYFIFFLRTYQHVVTIKY